MPLFAIGLLLIAAVLHTTWNLLLKRAGEKYIAVWWSSIIGPLAFLPAIFIAGFPSSAIWHILIISALFEIAYYIVLAEAYKDSDFSLVYPMGRGAAPALPVLPSPPALIPSRARGAPPSTPSRAGCGCARTHENTFSSNSAEGTRNVRCALMAKAWSSTPFTRWPVSAEMAIMGRGRSSRQWCLVSTTSRSNVRCSFLTRSHLFQATSRPLRSSPGAGRDRKEPRYSGERWLAV